jgi:SPP1 family phage portal protein
MPVIYMDRASIESLTEKDIRDIIDENYTDMKYQRLYDYYLGKHRILSEKKKDSTAPNNRLVNNMAKYITDTATGYFVGMPVVYNSQNEEYLKTVQDIFDYNDEQDHNMELAKNCSIGGSCFEMLYLDEEAKIRMTRVPPQGGIMICETDSGFSQPMAFIRTVISRDKDDNMIRKVEFWNASLVMHFRSVNGGYLNLESVEEHYWQDVPFTEYINNEERTGDFEGVVTMIDAYNKVQSNTANYFQYNDDAILKVLKLGDVSSNDIRDMKEKGAIILEDGGDVDWLLKQVDDTALENYKTRLREDIHTLANVPHLCDESFGGNLSGVAISYKLWGLEQMCAIKARKFKKGLQRRIELITNILNIMGHSFDYRDIVPKFRRNKPENNLETAQIVTMLSNDLSRETRLQMIPAVENVKEEIDKLEAEKKQDQEEFGVYENFAKAFQTAPEQTPEVTDGPEGTE